MGGENGSAYLLGWRPLLPVTISLPAWAVEEWYWQVKCGSTRRLRPGCRRFRGRAAPAPRWTRRVCPCRVAPAPRDSPPPTPCARYAARPITWRVSFRGIPVTHPLCLSLEYYSHRLLTGLHPTASRGDLTYSTPTALSDACT